jgi:ABC-type arginine/histidine transport system permease subunit
MNQTQIEDTLLQIPMELVKDCTDNKAALFVYGWLAAYQGAPVSVEIVAIHCGISRLEALDSMEWLEAKGWIGWCEEPGKTSPCPVVTASTERA